MLDKDTIIYIAAVLTTVFLIGLVLVASHDNFVEKERCRKAMMEEQKVAKQIAAENSKKLDMLLDIVTNAVANAERK
jgi:hypothetical protein